MISHQNDRSLLLRNMTRLHELLHRLIYSKQTHSDSTCSLLFICVLQLLHTISILMPYYAAQATEGSGAISLWQMLMLFFGCVCLFLFPMCGTRHICIYICRLSRQSLANISESTGCFMMLVAMVTSRNQTKGETGRGGGAPMQVGDCPCALCWILLTCVWL